MAALRSAVPGADIYGRYRLAYGGIAVRVRLRSNRPPPAGPGVVAVQRDHLEQPQTSVTPQFLGAPRRVEEPGRPGRRRRERHRRRARHGRVAGEPGLSGPGHRPGAGRSYQCEFGDGSRLLGPTFECNDKLIGAHAMVRTYMRFVGALPGEFCDNRTLECSARDADGHGTHTSTTAAGQPRRVRAGLRDRARADQRRRPGRPRHRLSSVSRSGVLQLRLDPRGAARHPRRHRRDQLLHRRRATPTPIRWRSPSSTPIAAGISVNARPATTGPGPQTAGHGGPWVTTVGASTSPRWFMTTLYLSDGTATRSTFGAPRSRTASGRRASHGRGPPRLRATRPASG